LRARRDRLATDLDVGGGTPQKVGHDRLQAQDLVQDADPGTLVPGRVRLAERIVAEQVPGGQRDELAGGDHPGRAERDALAEHLRVAAALVDQVRDEVVTPLPAPGPDRRPDIEEVERGEYPVAV